MSWTVVAGAAVSVVGGMMSSDSADKASEIQQKGNQEAIGETKRQYNQTREDLAPYRDAGSAALSRLRTLLGIGGGGSSSSRPAPTREQFMRASTSSGVPGGFDLTAPFRGGPATGPLMSPQESGIGPDGQPVLAFARPGAGQEFDEDAYNRAMAAWQAGQVDPNDPESGSLLRKFSASDLDSDAVYQSGLKFGLDEGTKALERRALAGGSYDSGATLKALTRFGNDYGSTKAEGAYGRYTGEQDRTFGKLSGVAGMGSGATTVGVNAGANSATNLSNLYTGGANAAAAAQIAGGNAMSGGLNNVNQMLQLRQLSGGGQRALTSGSTYDPGQFGGGDAWQ